MQYKVLSYVIKLSILIAFGWLKNPGLAVYQRMKNGTHGSAQYIGLVLIICCATTVSILRQSVNFVL